MRELNFGITFHFQQNYYPSNRHKKVRTRDMVTCRDIPVKVLDESEFPIAFRVTDYVSIQKGLKDYSDYESIKADFVPLTEEIRTFNNRLYKPRRYSHGACISDLIQTPDELRDVFNGIDYRFKMDNHPDIMFDNSKSTVISDNLEEHVRELKNAADNYVIFNNQIWEESGEPMYVINTFGLGHNHGGTGFFIEYFYNNNISSRNYFNALHYDDAIKYFDKVASGRGDTESVGKYGPDYIEVLMPEMVHRNPMTDHGDGDPFMNSLENIIENSSDATEAGILCMMTTAMSM